MNTKTISRGHLDDAIVNLIKLINQMDGAQRGLSEHMYQPHLIAVTEYLGTYNVWFKAKRSIADFFVPRCADSSRVGLQYLRLAMGFMEDTQVF
jgi:hypothetical protein